jgi:GNAT superfamily N-acetyltransferase
MTAGADALPGQETLLASWEALAATSPGARTFRTSDAAGAIFPEWGALNNTILLNDGDMASDEALVAGLATCYGRAGIGAWALWVPSRSTDFDAPDVVTGIGAMTRDTTTLVMQHRLRGRFRPHDGVVRTSVAAATLVTDEPVPEVRLARPSPSRVVGWALVQEGHAVAGASSLLHGSDCGLYAVGTVARWRRRGLARALVGHILADAVDRGARTASLQSTVMGAPLYESLGFVAVGRYEEWVTPNAPSRCGPLMRWSRPR